MPERERKDFHRAIHRFNWTWVTSGRSLGGGCACFAEAGVFVVEVAVEEVVVVDEAAVAAALDRGHLRAFACDVGTAPDQRPDPTLAARPDVVATPHLGGLTPENADAQARSSVEQIAALVRGEEPPRLANPEVWST